jgi:hypothetical protein
MHSKQPAAFRDGDEAHVISCGIFKAKTDNPGEAMRLVNDGKAEVFKPQSFYRDRLGAPSLDDL